MKSSLLSPVIFSPVIARWLPRLALAASLLAWAWSAPVFAQAPRGQDAAVIWRLIDYVAVDYPSTVRDGKIVSAPEYQEMQEFAATIAGKIAALPANAGKSALQRDASQLIRKIDGRLTPAEVTRQARALAADLIAAYPVPLAPARPPDLARGRALYQQTCTACHGTTGAGDGPAAAALTPPPVDFTDRSRARQRSLFALYQVIGQGIEGTAMASYAGLSDQDRWALAFQVGQFAYPEQAPGIAPKAGAGPVASLQQLVQITPAALEAQVGEQQANAITAYLRRRPAGALPAAGSQLAIARAQLAKTLAAYDRGDRAAAKAAALSAYLDGFEPLEPVLASRAPKLLQRVEQSMLGLRAGIERNDRGSEVRRSAGDIAVLLDETDKVLAHPASAGGWSGFLGAVTILVREGLEALLIVIAIIAFLRKAQRAEALPYVHGGWLAALVAGAATWALATYAISFGGAQREVIAGFSALFAAAVLVSVGIWMHQKSYAGRWQQYLQDKMSQALSRQSAWFLFLLSFVAVYREVFETILFYAAIWNDGDNSAVVAGFLAGVALLAGITVAMLRFSQRLPIGQFFSWSSLLMAVLAVVLTGKGVAGLQEAGWLSVVPIAFPRIDWLGIYPSLQVVGAQALTLLILLSGLLYNRSKAAIVATEPT